MTNKAISIFNQLRPLSIGYDDVFDHFESMFNHQYDSINVPNYPPYNIVKTGKYTYDIQVALAGYGKKDVDVKKLTKTVVEQPIRSQIKTNDFEIKSLMRANKLLYKDLGKEVK